MTQTLYILHSFRLEADFLLVSYYESVVHILHWAKGFYLYLRLSIVFMSIFRSKPVAIFLNKRQ
jgi:hypothetical protein